MHIILPPESGYIAVGNYQAGTVYKVDDAEGQRLISVKGFRLATAAEKKEGVEELEADDSAALTDSPSNYQ